jgi:hypothetical protein
LTATGLGIGTASPAQKLDVNGVVQIAAAAAPTTDSNFRLWSESGVGANIDSWNIKFNTGTGGTRTNIMFLSTAGKVGIGTTTPSQKFVVSNAGADNIVMAENSSAVIRMFMQAASASGSVGTLTNHVVQFLQNNDEKMRISTDGYVGIGTSNPTQSLTVGGAGSRIYLTGNNEDISMDGNANGQLSLDGNGYAFGIALNATGANLYTNSASRAVIFGTDEIERMRITGAGKVGIGTQAPAMPLEVLTGNGTLGIRINRHSSGVYYSDIIHAGSPDRLAFKVGDGSNIAERMSILSAGGITFNGDTAAANALNDYEEGTFTAALGGSTVAGSSPTTAGTYVKIGKIVTIDFAFQNVTVSGASGVNLISGLPFAPVLAQNQAGAQWSYNMTVGGGTTVWHLTGTNMWSYNTVSNAGWTSNAVRNSGGQYAWHTFTYRVA